MKRRERDELEYIVESVGPGTVTEGTLVSTLVDVYDHGDEAARAIVQEAIERGVVEEADTGEGLYRVSDSYRAETGADG